MASIEININKKNIFNELFSKDNRLILHKQILNKLNLTEISKDGKKQILEILQKNMKNIYDKLKLDKINQTNFKSIMVQYNNACLEQTINQLSNKKNANQESQSQLQDTTRLPQDASRLKFERDFNSNPNPGNKVMERPQTITNKKNQDQFLYPPGFEKSNNLDPRFDKLFKPIVENMDDNYKFNQYQSGKGGEDFGNRFDQLMSEREVETSIPKRPSTPDFLKPINTSSKGPQDSGFKMNQDSSFKMNQDSSFKMNQDSSFKMNQDSGFSNSNNRKPDRSLPQIKRRTGRPNFSDKIPENELDTGFLSSNDNNDLYDIDNIDKPVEVLEIEEDRRPFEQRLQSLERDRDSVNIQKTNKKINFQENINQEENDMDIINNLQPKSIEEIGREKKIQEQIKQEDEYNKRYDRQDSRQQDSRHQDSRHQDSRQQDSRHQDSRHQEQRYNNEENDLQENIDLKKQYQKQYMEKKNNKPLQHLQYLNEDDNNQNLIKTNKNVNMDKVQEALKKLGVNNDLYELNELKKENKILKKKINEISIVDDKSKFEFVKKEIGGEFTKLHEKENEIKKKEEEMKNLLKKYNYLYGLRHVQMDISPQNPLSNYVFEFPQIKNINGIKLMSYSIPVPRYNIEENKNNIFKIKCDDQIKEIKLNSGKYKIEHLLKLLTDKSDFNFELNYEEKVEIKNKDESETNFDIISTPLSVEVLGFTKEYINQTNYIADKTWDLRIEDKVYLFINNLEENIPFAVLYLGNQAVQQFKFDELIDLDKLEIVFKDSKARPYNFYGLTYSINIQLEINDPKENEII